MLLHHLTRVLAIITKILIWWNWRLSTSICIKEHWIKTRWLSTTKLLRRHIPSWRWRTLVVLELWWTFVEELRLLVLTFEEVSWWFSFEATIGRWHRSLIEELLWWLFTIEAKLLARWHAATKLL